MLNDVAGLAAATGEAFGKFREVLVCQALTYVLRCQQDARGRKQRWLGEGGSWGAPHVLHCLGFEHNTAACSSTSSAPYLQGVVAEPPTSGLHGCVSWLQ